MTFTQAARDLAGRTAILLGWRPPEFWAATPAELATIFAQLAPANAFSRDNLATLMERDPDG